MYWINIEKIGYISKISDIFDFFLDIFDFFLKKIMIFSIPVDDGPLLRPDHKTTPKWA